MNRGEASFILANIDRRVCDDELNEALDMAIKALEQEPRKITLEDVKEYCNPRYLTIITNELLYELTHPKIKALEQEPCGNAIDRAEAIKVASGYCHPANVANELAKMPPVTPQPKTGHWIEKDGFDGDTYYDCSECGES